MEDLSIELSNLKALLSGVLLRLSDLESENAMLRSENASLKLENAELRRRLGLNSENSSKPPSSDGLKKKPALTREKGGQLGGQTGHIGRTLERLANPDETILHFAAVCDCCGKPLCQDGGIVLSSRQVFDMPEPCLVSTEHRLMGIMCCGKLQVGTYPSGVNAPVQYGPRLRALGTILNTEYRMPFAKISRLFMDLYNYEVSEGTLTNANETAFEALAGVEEQIKTAVLASELVHFDETGMRVEGKLHWFHTACNAAFCYLFVHTQRGKGALRSTKSLLKDFKNWAIHDCWASYFDFSEAKHGLCNAHILRELEALTETGSTWAKEMATFLLKLYQESEKATKVLSNKGCYYVQYAAICAQADLEEPQPIKKPKGKPLNAKGRNLLNRLLKHKDAVLAFAFEPYVPFTNNTAERDIRHVKVKQKVAMSFRTFHGAEVYARVQSFVATARKQKQNAFQQLCRILNGEQYALSRT